MISYGIDDRYTKGIMIFLKKFKLDANLIVMKSIRNKKFKNNE